MAHQRESPTPPNTNGSLRYINHGLCCVIRDDWRSPNRYGSCFGHLARFRSNSHAKERLEPQRLRSEPLPILERRGGLTVAEPLGLACRRAGLKFGASGQRVTEAAAKQEPSQISTPQSTSRNCFARVTWGPAQLVNLS